MKISVNRSVEYAFYCIVRDDSSGLIDLLLSAGELELTTVLFEDGCF